MSEWVEMTLKNNLNKFIVTYIYMYMYVWLLYREIFWGHRPTDRHASHTTPFIPEHVESIVQARTQDFEKEGYVKTTHNNHTHL